MTFIAWPFLPVWLVRWATELIEAACELWDDEDEEVREA